MPLVSYSVITVSSVVVNLNLISPFMKVSQPKQDPNHFFFNVFLNQSWIRNISRGSYTDSCIIISSFWFLNLHYISSFFGAKRATSGVLVSSIRVRLFVCPFVVVVRYVSYISFSYRLLICVFDTKEMK